MATSEGPAARDRILDAAIRLFSERGYERTSLAAVAAAAGVSKALVLWHFQSKERLLREALASALAPYHVRVESLRGLDETDQLDRLIDAFFEFVDENASSIRFLLGLMLKADRPEEDLVRRVAGAYRLFGDVIAGVLARGKASGRLPSSVDPAAEGRIVLALMTGAVVERFIAGGVPGLPRADAAAVKRVVRDRLLGGGRRGATRRGTERA